MKNRKDKMTLKQKIKNSVKCHVWLQSTEEGHGFYVEVTKKELLKQVQKHADKVDSDRFRITDSFIDGRHSLFTG